jgi:putative endonuclease
MIEKGGYTYIMTNKHRTVLYIGVTSGLYTRVWQHKNGEGSKFTKKYKCFDIVYYEYYDEIETAIDREKQLKGWKREWKDELIRKFNPHLLDLFNDIQDLD